MAEYAPFFARPTTDRNVAFADIKSLSIKIVQDPYGMYCITPSQSTYSKANVPRYERCRNPRCQQGGLDLQQIVHHYPNGEYNLHCNGHEGSPKGRRKGDPCDNSFTITLSVEKE